VVYSDVIQLITLLNRKQTTKFITQNFLRRRILMPDDSDDILRLSSRNTAARDPNFN